MGDPGERRESIVRAKIRIPAASADYLSRPRLNEALDACAQHRLTLVVAPAGYGKTSLVSFWARHREERPAWLSLNEADAPAGRFWRYLSHALSESSGQPFSRIFAEMDPQADRVPVHLIDALLSAIEKDARPIVCVLDDFHRIDGSVATMETIGYFLENCPENFHLVVASRSAPPFKLAKMRAQGELLEIKQLLLSFTKREVSAGLAAMKVRASDAFAEKVFDATFGWPVGIKLISLSLGKGEAPAFDGKLPFAAAELTTDYLFEEVVERMPPHVKDFVLGMSVVENFCLDLAVSIMRATDSGYQSKTACEALRYLGDHSLFITEVEGPDGEPWYTFHALLRDTLRWRAKHGSIEDARARDNAASAWFAQRGLFDQAVRHASNAGNHDGVRDIIIGQWANLLDKDQSYTLMNWFEALPDDYISRHPKLCLFEIAPLSSMGRFQEAERRFLQAKQASSLKNDLFDATAITLLCILKAVEGDETGARETAQEALAQLPPSEKRFRALVNQILGSSLVDDDIIAMRDRYRAIAADPETLENAGVACSAFSNLANIEALVGNANEALACARQAYAVHKPQAYLPMFNIGYAAEAIACYLQGSLQRAAQRCQSFFENVTYNYTARVVSQMYGIESFITWHDGEAEQVPALLESASQTHARALLDVFPSVPFLEEFSASPLFSNLLEAQANAERPTVPQQYFACCMRRIARGEADARAVAALLESIDGDYRLAKVQTGILLCLLLEEAGDRARAEKECADALAAAREHALIQPFLDASPAVKQVVARLAKSGASDWANDVNKACAALSRRAKAPASRHDGPSLSEREREVMELAAAGMSTDDIAATLFISRETVKKHLGNTYAKLGTHNRAHAVSILKEQGLL